MIIIKGTLKFIVSVLAMILLATSVCNSSNGDGVRAKLQSYNYSHMYVRNADFDVRIDEIIAPETDFQWELVPGLANSKEGMCLFNLLIIRDTT